jgi:hypothetical protein
VLAANTVVEHNGHMISYMAPLVLGAAFIGLCLVLRDEQRARRSRESDGAVES